MRSVSLVISVVSMLGVLAACSAEPPIVADVAPATPTPTPKKADRPVREHYLGMAVPEHEPVPFPNVRGECEPGERKLCSVLLPGARGRPSSRHTKVCMLMADGTTRFNDSDCATPLVVAFDDQPIEFLQPVGSAASFAVGPFARTEWVAARTPWLTLDANASGCVEDQSELFRFDELASLDDNHDGLVDARDAAFARLGLWADRDQNRRCTPDEMTSLQSAGIVSLQVDFTSKPEHGFGSYEGETASVAFRAPGGQLRRGRIVDVYLAPMP
jgi:hypothetical protein